MNSSGTPTVRLRGGFTLLELMVAMAVLTLLIVMLMGLVDSATKLWRQNETRVDAYREARAALNVISDELRSMVASTNPHYFSTNPIGLSGQVDSSADSLFFLTLLPPSAQPSGSKSSICAVGYFRQWDKQNVNYGGVSAKDPTPVGYHLFRTFYSSDLTFSNLSQNQPPLKDLAVPTTQGQPAPEILARNICSFELNYFTTNGASVAAKYTNWSPAAGVSPQMIEVRIVAIPDELAKRLNGNQSAWTTNSPQVKPQMRTFVSRIQLPTVPP